MNSLKESFNGSFCNFECVKISILTCLQEAEIFLDLWRKLDSAIRSLFLLLVSDSDGLKLPLQFFSFCNTVLFSFDHSDWDNSSLICMGQVD